MGVLTGIIASTILSKLFSRSNSSKVEPRDYKQLDDKLELKELPKEMKRTITPKEQFLDSIGKGAITDKSSSSSLYSSLSENSKAQVNASYEVYNTLDDRISDMDKRMEVMNENLKTVNEGVSAYGKIGAESSSKAGFLSKAMSAIGSGVKSVLSTIALLPATLMSLGYSAIEKWFGNGDSNQGDPGNVPTNESVAPETQTAIDESKTETEEAQQGAQESQEGVDDLTTEINNLESKLNETVATLAGKSGTSTKENSDSPEEPHIFSRQDQVTEKGNTPQQVIYLKSQIYNKKAEREQKANEVKNFQIAGEIAENKGERAQGSWEAQTLFDAIPEDELEYEFEGRYKPTPSARKGTTSTNAAAQKRISQMAQAAASELTDNDISRLNEVLKYIKVSDNITAADVVGLAGGKVTEKEAQEFLDSNELTRDSSVGALLTAYTLSNLLPNLATELKGRTIGINATTDYNMSTRDKIIDFVSRILTGTQGAVEYSKDKTDAIYDIFEDVVEGDVIVRDDKGNRVKPYDFIAAVTYDPKKFTDYTYYSGKHEIPLENLLKKVKGSAIMSWADAGFDGLSYVTDKTTGQVTATSDWDTSGQFDKYTAYDLVTGGLDNLVLTQGSSLEEESDGSQGAKLASMTALNANDSEINELVEKLGGNYDDIDYKLYEQAKKDNPDFYETYEDWQLYSPYSNLQDIYNNTNSTTASLTATVEMLTKLLAENPGQTTNVVINNLQNPSYDTDR